MNDEDETKYILSLFSDGATHANENYHLPRLPNPNRRGEDPCCRYFYIFFGGTYLWLPQGVRAGRVEIEIEIVLAAPCSAAADAPDGEASSKKGAGIGHRFCVQRRETVDERQKLFVKSCVSLGQGSSPERRVHRLEKEHGNHLRRGRGTPAANRLRFI